jgi:hypothetical protein
MRDNFTNTRTNFQYAADEITDLQNNVVLKAALSGTTLDNNLGNNLVYNALVKGISGTVVAIANTSGTITIDCSAGPYQSINMAGNIALSFTSNTWPTAGTMGMLRTQITVDQVGRTLTLPSTVSNGIVGIQGYASNVITFANTGTYEFGFSTTNAGNAITIFDLNRPLSYYSNDVTMAGNLTVNGDINGNITLSDISVSTVTAAGNVVAGNVNSGGVVSSTGNVTGGNIITAALVQGLTVSATGNVQGGNLRTAGLISATGNITGGNILGGANVNATTHTGTTASLSGNITGGNVLSSAVVSAVGNATILSGTAVPAGGTTGAGYKLSSTANLGVFFGSGAPTLSAAQGSLYLRTDGSSTTTRMYINTNGSTTWTNVVTSA